MCLSVDIGREAQARIAATSFSLEMLLIREIYQKKTTLLGKCLYGGEPWSCSNGHDLPQAKGQA